MLKIAFVLLVVHAISDADAAPKVSAVLVFGDSTSDPGNNNFILTAFKGNFPPYGRDYPNKKPTGRFTNGLLASDLIARYLGVKDNVPPYLDPSLTVHDLMTGVSFASAGSGFDPLTPTISNVIPLARQLEYFREYKTRLAGKLGKTRTMEIVNNALYIVSAGTNDFVVNYFTLPIRRQKYSLPSYMDFVMNKQLEFLQCEKTQPSTPRPLVCHRICRGEIVGVVNGSETTQPEEDAQGVLRKWKIKTRKAMYVLKSTVEEEILYHIRDSPNPKEALDVLAIMFSKRMIRSCDY